MYVLSTRYAYKKQRNIFFTWNSKEKILQSNHQQMGLENYTPLSPTLSFAPETVKYIFSKCKVHLCFSCFSVFKIFDGLYFEVALTQQEL